MQKRLLAVACSFTLIASVTVGALKYLGIVFPDSGPLGYLGGNEIGAVEEARRPFATPFFGITNVTDEALHVESVDLLKPSRGLALLGMAACDPGGPDCVMSTSYRRWPPPLRLRRLDGYVIPPGGRLAVIAGWRADVPRKYRVRGILLRYRQGLRRFVTEVGPRLVVEVERRRGPQST